MPRVSKKSGDKAAKPPRGEHIFPNTILEPLALEWKKMVKEESPHSVEKLEEIVKLSTPMFIRLAQYEGFHRTVDLDTLILAAQARVANWLLYWDPAKGILFTWMSKCAKFTFLAEVSRMSQHRKRFHATSDNLEKFAGSVDTAVSNNEALESIEHTLRDLHSRWSDTQVLDCIRFHVASIVENPKGNKKKVIKAGAYAAGFSVDSSKFFYNWALFMLRDAMFEKISLPYTDQDLLRLKYSFTYIPDLLNIITYQQLLKMIALLGGTKIKFPTVTQLQQAKRDYRIFKTIERSSHTPEAVKEAAIENDVSVGTAEEVYADMVNVLDHSRDDETPLYGH